MNSICLDEEKGDIKVYRSKINRDDRGFFYRTFCGNDIIDILGAEFKIQQINLSYTSNKGTVRGLHFQKSPYSEDKLIRCLSGKIFDVLIDVRKNSSTYLKQYTFNLEAHDGRMIHVPKGFAHGFQALEDNTQLLYIHSQEYRKEFEDGLNVLDPSLSIEWPLVADNISSRDSKFDFL